MTQAHIGVIGVGTMGSALALNFAEKGQDVALWNLELSAVDRLIASAGGLAARLQRCETLADLVAALPAPRAIVPNDPGGRAGGSNDCCASAFVICGRYHH